MSSVGPPAALMSCLASSRPRRIALPCADSGPLRARIAPILTVLPLRASRSFGVYPSIFTSSAPDVDDTAPAELVLVLFLSLLPHAPSASAVTTATSDTTSGRDARRRMPWRTDPRSVYSVLMHLSSCWRRPAAAQTPRG